jgi:TonB family protein
MPEFPGGMTAMMQFLAENVCYPEAAEKAGTQGRVIATFIVEKDGSITNIKIVKSVSKELDAEAKRVIEAMPNWKPGKQSGEPVRVKYTIPITFRLSSPSPSTQNQQAEPTKPVTQSTSN